jgi:hypothetical protein
VFARVPRLGERILDEGLMRLLGFRYAELGLRHDLDAERREHVSELAQLARIVARENQSSHKQES